MQFINELFGDGSHGRYERYVDNHWYDYNFDTIALNMRYLYEWRWVADLTPPIDSACYLAWNSHRDTDTLWYLVTNDPTLDDNNDVKVITQRNIADTSAYTYGLAHYIMLHNLPGIGNKPTDPDDDKLFEDLNGNGRRDFNDVVTFFNQMDYISNTEPILLFDFNTNGRIDFNDVVILFSEI